MKIAIIPSLQFGNVFAGNPTWNEGIWAKATAALCQEEMERLGLEAKVFAGKRKTGEGEVTHLNRMIAESLLWKPNYLISIHSDYCADKALTGVLVLDASDKDDLWAGRVGRDMARRMGLPFKGVWTYGQEARKLNFLSALRSHPWCKGLLFELSEFGTVREADFIIERRTSLGRAVAQSFAWSIGWEKPEEEDMPIDVVHSPETVAAAMEALRKRGLIQTGHNPTDAASVGLLAILVERALEAAGVPIPNTAPEKLELATEVAGYRDIDKTALAALMPLVTPVGLLDAYIKWSKVFDLNMEVVLAQALLETGDFEFGGQVKREQNNWCGLKDTVGASFATFADVEAGAIAHLAHLSAYVHPDHVNDKCNFMFDPRHPSSHTTFQAQHGKVVILADLGNGRWTPDKEYATKMMTRWNGRF